MNILDLFRGYMSDLTGGQKEFEELLAKGDITAVQERMTNNKARAVKALEEYDGMRHHIMKRPDKIITDKKGNVRRKEPVWKLPIPYQVYINEISVVFLYGRPVKWAQVSEGTDEAFAAFLDIIRRTRFDSKIRQCKRIAGAETESAMLFRVFRDDEGKPDVQIRVLAHSKGDEIFVKWDQYENIISIAWGYYTREKNDEVLYHFDIYTKDTVYRCTKQTLGWEIAQEENFIGKIPIILFQQGKEWQGVETLIHREESIVSRSADTNDYFADPMAVINADVVRNMPDKGETGKLLVTNDAEGVDKAIKYVTWDNAPESKRQELEWLHKYILQMTFTPDITLDSLKSISQLSAKALRTVMMLANIKAARHKEQHDELLDRASSLITAIIGNVLDVSLKAQCEALRVGHEFQEPFGEDVADDLTNIVKAYDAGILSTEGAIELNPLVKDVQREKGRLEEENEEGRKSQQNLFGDIENAGAQSAFGTSSDRGNSKDDK